MEELALPMVVPTQPNPPPRPRTSDRGVVEAAARALLPEVMRWLGGPEREEDVLEDLLRAVPAHDGYRAASILDERGWGADEELVDILSGSFSEVLAAHRDHVKRWAAANGIRPEYAVGDIVSTPWGAGRIAQVITATAEYVVQTEEWLAKYPDQAGQEGGYVCPFEKAALATGGRNEQ